MVTTNIASGSVILSGGHRDVSLVWNRKGAGPSTDPRGLPAGSWRVRTTRIEREQDGVHWFVSSTSPHGRKLKLEAGKTAHLELSPVVNFAGKATRRRRTLKLNFAITSKDGGGLSVYRNLKRVPVRYEVKDRKGRVLHSGRMNYG